MKMSANSVVHIRLDEEDKAKATAVLAEMGLSVSSVVRLLLKRVAAERSVPFDLRIPNAETRDAMAEAEEIIRARNARFGKASDIFDDLEKSS
jgi:DNA-damage-inducible protein J